MYSNARLTHALDLFLTTHPHRVPSLTHSSVFHSIPYFLTEGHAPHRNSPYGVRLKERPARESLARLVVR